MRVTDKDCVLTSRSLAPALAAAMRFAEGVAQGFEAEEEDPFFSFAFSGCSFPIATNPGEKGAT